MKRRVAEQQIQIDELRGMVLQLLGSQQPSWTEQSSNRGNLGQLASTQPAAISVAAGLAINPGSPEPQSAPEPPKPGVSPLQVKIGDSYITPAGFMDLTSISRSTGPGSSIGTNFGNIPFSNTPQGNLQENHLSAQNSRIGFRVDTLMHGTKIPGYLETDFLGFVPANAAVTSNSLTDRLRLYLVDVQRGKYEFAAGQTWSLLTPG